MKAAISTPVAEWKSSLNSSVRCSSSISPGVVSRLSPGFRKVWVISTWSLSGSLTFGPSNLSSAGAPRGIISVRLAV